MKVLMQHWCIPCGENLTSISKDKEQLGATIERIEKKYNDTVTDGGAYEVEVPDDHAFAYMVENDTVFLHSDELDVVTYPD